MVTQRDTVRLLCKTMVSRLENDQVIMFPPRLRQEVQEELYSKIGPYILTDGDLRERALAKMQAKSDELEESKIAESDQFKAAKAAVKESFGDDELNGFYFQKPLKEIAGMVCAYFMNSSHIEDVFETDEEIERRVVDLVKRFNPDNIH